MFRDKSTYQVGQPVLGANQIGDEVHCVDVGVAEDAVVERLLLRPEDLDDVLEADERRVLELLEQLLHGGLLGVLVQLGGRHGI